MGGVGGGWAGADRAIRTSLAVTKNLLTENLETLLGLPALSLRETSAKYGLSLSNPVGNGPGRRSGLRVDPVEASSPLLGQLTPVCGSAELLVLIYTFSISRWGSRGEGHSS
jgi:hypothetical protein